MRWQSELPPHTPQGLQRIEDMPPAGPYVHHTTIDDIMSAIIFGGLLVVAPAVVLIGAIWEAYLR